MNLFDLRIQVNKITPEYLPHYLYQDFRDVLTVYNNVTIDNLLRIQAFYNDVNDMPK